MRTILVVIAVLMSGAAGAQSEQELHEHCIELQKLKWALQQQQQHQQRPMNRNYTPVNEPPAILYRNNDASLGP